MENRNYTEGKSDKELIGQIGFGGPVTVDKDTPKRVLITGAGSYIGEAFKAYASANYSALTIDSIDMLDPKWAENSFSGYDIVYHVAGIAHSEVGKVDEATKERYYSVNTDLAIRVCEKAKNEGVNEFIFMSSMIVYGDSAPYGHKKIVDENTVPHASNTYGDSKLQADVGVRNLADDDFKVIVLRPPMIYGKGSKGNYPTLSKLSQKMWILPKVENERSMLFIDNLCEFLCQIMLVRSFEGNQIILIPQNAEWSNTSLMAKDIAAAHGHKILLIGGPLKLAVRLGSKMKTKIGGMLRKAYGNCSYVFSLSTYEGIEYQKYSLTESISLTEK